MKLKYHFNFTEKPELYFRIVLTNRCNSNCLYCFREADVGGSQGKLTYSFLDRLIIVGEKYKIPKIHFTGGEPLLEGGLASFIGRIRSKSNIDVGLTTNGTLLKIYSSKLYDAGLRRINVSIPTLDPLKYRLICQQNGLEQVLQNVDDLISLKFSPIKINVPLFKRNVDEIAEFLAYFLPKDNVILRFFSLLPNPGLKAQDCLMNEETIRKLELETSALPDPLKQESTRRVFYRAPMQPPLKICKNCAENTKCEDQAKAIRITTDGKLSLCLLNPKHSFQVETLDEIGKGVERLLNYCT